MFRRLATLSLVAVSLSLLSGCIEMTQTFTLNPDGRGKVLYDVKMPPDLGGGLNIGGPPGGPKEKTPEELKQAFLKNQMNAPGVTAWKDVSVKWTDDGRLHFIGTAYFEKLDDLEGATDNAGPGGGKGGPKNGPSIGAFQLIKEKEGVWKITARKNPGGLNVAPPNNNNNVVPFDPTKATPMEWDEFVLKMRIGYQTAKPFLALMFTDMKIKTVFQLPGEPGEVQGFKKEGTRRMAHTLDGNALIGVFKKFMLQDVASWKRAVQAFNKNQPVDPKQLMEKLGVPAEMVEPSMTVRVEAKDQFDYAKELQAARTQYPRLREQLKLDPGVGLPGEKQ